MLDLFNHLKDQSYHKLDLICVLSLKSFIIIITVIIIDAVILL